MKTSYDIIIIGAGMTGLTAAIYAARGEKSVLVIEQEFYGGQILNAGVIENYPACDGITGYDLSTKLYKQAKTFGAEFLKAEVKEIKADVENSSTKTVITTEGDFKADSLIIACGTKRRKLNLKNENEFLGKGVSYCAICDGALYKRKRVAVVGGGNTAIDDALTLANYCREVYIIHRSSEYRAEGRKISMLKDMENVKFLDYTEVSELHGDKQLNGIKIYNKKSRKYSDLDIDGLFISIGQIPNNEIYSSIVELADNGYIKANENCKTNIDGIYAAGDCRTKGVRQLTTAAADGTIAALEAIAYTNKRVPVR